MKLMTKEKKGFKKTDFELIPNDWTVKKIGDIAPLQRGFDLPKYKLVKGQYPVVYSNGIANHHNVYMAKGPGVVTGRSGTLGNLTYVEDNFWPHNTALWVTNFYGNHPRFIYYLYNHIGLDRFGSGSGVPTLNRNDVHDFVITIPLKFDEQQAIAEALSDVDELIHSLDGLIQKKQAIKKGTMQQLLTGKKRLPGFDREWEVKKLGDVCQIISGGTPSTRNSEYWNGNIEWCTPTDITSNKGKFLSKTSRKITDQGLKNSSATLLPKGTLLLCSRATVGEVKIATTEISTNQGFKSLICSESVDNEFLYYLVILEKQKFIDKAFGSTFLEISKKNTSEIEFYFPSVEEQNAIAQILSDMDRELQTLRQKREKYVQIKQGMMQELLTGRVRLV